MPPLERFEDAELDVIDGQAAHRVVGSRTGFKGAAPANFGMSPG